MNGHINEPIPDPQLDFDVAIIGSGISGINAAYRVQTQAPQGTTYAILEARDDIGGTWNFFKYPGIRSDSDLHTFGFQWRPWKEKHPIAEADAILRYLRESAGLYGIDKKVRFGHRLISADWSSRDLCWRLDVRVGGELRVFHARFLILGTGYYDYENPLEANIPGLERFKGQVVHPQSWREDLQYEGKRMVIIGSGATAVTLLPNVAKKAEHVVMLQRSPSYVFSLPSKDKLGGLLRWLLPTSLADRIQRIRWICLGYFLFYFCRTFPNAAKRFMKRETIRQLPKDIPWDPHFKPAYNPWEQRLCLCPDGDFYKALRSGKASIATGKIKTVTETGIELEDGSFIGTDIIVTATGLRILLAGGTQFSVDGEKLVVPDKFLWKGVMLQDLPNASFVVGYTNAVRKVKEQILTCKAHALDL
jgi:cation diffusion facilitator CzcD-associated flavoprotein CzcO